MIATKEMNMAPGALLRDRERDVIGVVTGFRAGRVQLRPVGGGIPWGACPEQLETVDRRGELRARVRELNLHSSDRRHW